MLDHPARAVHARADAESGYRDDPEPPLTPDELAEDVAMELAEARMEAELGNCTCASWPHTAHSPGSVASWRAGDTDPDCPLHGRN
jgi:hypothetical protein